MIVATLSDSHLRKALYAVAHPEEDVVTDAALAAEALQRGFPRLVVRVAGDGMVGRSTGIPVLHLDDVLLRRWEAERRATYMPLSRADFLTRRLRVLVERSAAERTWVDVALADLGRAAGARLPLPLRAFGRRTMEFPVHYRSLHPIARACSLSRGALKAKFRRRGLASPYTYVRWFRIIAVSEVLSDRSVSVAAAAHRLGFTSDGNLCRMMGGLTQLTPTEARTAQGWNTLLITFARAHLTPEALHAWAGLEGLFQRRVA